MHHLRLKAAVDKYTPLAESKTKDEIKTLLAADDKEYSDEEQAKILASLNFPSIGEPPVTPPATEEVPAVNITPAQPLTTVSGVEQFDYKNLVDKNWQDGGAFTDYNSFLATKLMNHSNYDFEVWAADVLKKQRYPGMPNTPSDVVGIKITGAEPIMRTRIEARYAIEMNRQVENSKRFYLLKK